MFAVVATTTSDFDLTALVCGVMTSRAALIWLFFGVFCDHVLPRSVPARNAASVDCWNIPAVASFPFSGAVPVLTTCHCHNDRL